jgi:4'-phosphopantetheinyl transferase EntD
MPDPAALTAALRAMLPAGAGVGACAIGDAGPLWPGEAVPGAVPARQAEFAAGRTAARLALADLGLPPVAVPMGADRAPHWPAGLAGSLTHAGGVALAAVLRAPAAVGIDIEPDADLPADVLDSILTPAERAALPDLRAARVVFSAKEAFFKAQYPRTGRMIGFDAADVALQDGGLVLTVAAPLPGLPAGVRLAGRWARAGGFVLTALCLP